MKTRRGVALIAFLAALCFLLAGVDRLAHRANRQLLSILTERFAPLVQRGWSVDSVAIKYGCVHFFGLRYRGRAPYELWVEDVRVGYSLTNLLRQRFRVRNLPNSILCSRPHLILHLHSRHDAPTGPDSSNGTTTASVLRELTFLENVVISDGQISYADSAGGLWRFFDEVDGWIYRQQDWKAGLQLAARPRGARDIRVELLGRFDVPRGRLDSLEVHVRPYEVGAHFPLPLPSFLQMKGGLLAGRFVVREDPRLPRRLDLVGEAHFTRGSVALRGSSFRFDSIAVHARVEHWDLFLDSAAFRLNECPFRAQGIVRDLLNPRFELQLACESADLGLLFPYPSGAGWLQPSGRALLTATLRGHYNNPQVEAEMRMPMGRVAGYALRNLVATVSLVDSVIRIDRLSALLPRGSLRARAMLDLRTAERPLLACAGLVLSARGQDGKGKLLQDTLTVTYEGSSGHGRLRATAAVYRSGLPPLRLSGEGDIQGATASVRVRSEQGTLRGQGHFTFKRGGSIENFRLVLHGAETAAPYLGLVSSPRFLRGKIGADAELSGNRRVLQGTLQISVGKQGARRPLLSTRGELKPAGRRWEGKFDIEYTPVSGRTSAGGLRLQVGGWRRAPLAASLELESWLRASLERDRRDGTLRLRVTCSKAPLQALLGLDPSVYSGFLDAALEYERDSNQDSRCNLRAEGLDLRSHGEGPYNCRLVAHGRDGSLALDSLDVRWGERPILFASGQVDLREQWVDASLRTDTLRLARVLPAFGVRKGIADGLLSFWSRVRGSLAQPEFTGELLVSHGRFFFEPFDLLRVAFSPDASGESSSAPHVNLEQLLLLRTGVYRLEGDGKVPLSADAPVELRLSGPANVLQLAADALGFLRNPRCEGEIRLQVGGTVSSPRLSGAEASFTNGRAEFPSVLPKVTEARGHLRLEPDGFLHLVELSGRMGGEWFRIANARASDLRCRVPLEEFVVSPLGVSAGILTFETGPRGVPLNLYGLQEKSDFGWYQFLGAEPEEPFVVAGPWSRPRIRGTWKLRDVRFQYPFVEGTGNKTSWVLDFLSRAEWDLRLLPEHNVRYVRTIPSAVDNVYVNLLIDQGGEGVKLTGCLAEGTFRLAGRIESRNGIVEYLDMDFRLESAGAEFDRASLYPVVWGRARATVTDTTGMPTTLYLTLLMEDYTEERRFDQRVRDRQTRARWDRVRFQLSSDHPSAGQSEAEILGALGYSDRKLRAKAAEMVGMSAENWLVRPLVRPFERSLQRALGFDLLRLRSRIARNFIEWNLANQTYSPWYLMRSTRWEMGKYLLNDVFLTYTGEIQSGFRYELHQQKLGLRHTIGLEYRLSPDLILELAYDYDSLLLWQKTDKKILLRHSFPF
ncbi:MAG: translocation/assembly module TamB [candidate division KSB1 bacterium]|nr:translocation/assembly module TamB [candidate division KSB1 bacterium]